MRHTMFFQQQRQTRRHLEYAMGQEPNRQGLEEVIHLLSSHTPEAPTPAFHKVDARFATYTARAERAAKEARATRKALAASLSKRGDG